MPDFSSSRVKRRLLVLFTLIAIGWVIWSARGSLTPFAIGAVIAYLLAPVVLFIDRMLHLPPRFSSLSSGISVIIAYVIVLAALGIAGYFLVPPLINQTNEFIDNAPGYIDDARIELENLNRFYHENIPEVIRTNLENNIDAIKAQLSGTGKTAAKVTFSAVSTVLGFLAGLALLPLWVFYVLKDQRRGLAWFYNLWPPDWQEDVRNIVGIIDALLATYVRVQLFLGVVIGIVTGIAMWIIGIHPAIVLGLFAGVFELVPVLGPWIAFLVAAIVTLATDPGRIFLVALAFLGIQQLENTFLVPKLQGDALRINPAIIVMLLAIGGSLWGLVGLIIVVPFTAVLRDIFVYLYRRASDLPPAESIPKELLKD
ncbi:MAG TPA: AI-2E family transporter [Nitrolancea sp.]|nr:AI-2E family transporter [Nitrolancea sp.]